MDSHLEQGPVGRGDTQHGAAGAAAPVGDGSPKEILEVLLHHAGCSGGMRMSCDNLCLCSGWAVSFMSDSLLSYVWRVVCPWGSWYLRELLCSHPLVLSQVSHTLWTLWEVSRKICVLLISFLGFVLVFLNQRG